MKKILVAGAGHGGLVAAAILAKQGYDVTVYEAKKKEDLGHALIILRKALEAYNSR